MKRLRAVRAWIAEGEYETKRGYAYIHFRKSKPITDTNYKVYQVEIRPITPKPTRRKRK